MNLSRCGHTDSPEFTLDPELIACLNLLIYSSSATVLPNNNQLIPESLLLPHICQMLDILHRPMCSLSPICHLNLFKVSVLVIMMLQHTRTSSHPTCHQQRTFIVIGPMCDLNSSILHIGPVYNHIL